MMKRQPCNNLTSYVEMRIFSLTLEYLGGGCMLKWQQVELYHLLKLQERGHE